jgi:hypothetical protein
MKRIVVVAIVLCLAVLAAPVPVGAQNTLTVVSDTTWKVRAFSSRTGFPKVLGTAEAVCLNASAPANCPSDAVLYGDPSGNWLADLSSIPGAIWIWAPGINGSTSPADLQTFWFSKVIHVPAKPLAGSISIAADDYIEILVNGKLVAAYGSVTDVGAARAAANSLRKFSVKNHLHKGNNQILIRAQNGPSSFAGTCNPCNYMENPAGIVFGLNISY